MVGGSSYKQAMAVIRSANPKADLREGQMLFLQELAKVQ
jgi:hypothetical protein